MAILVNSNFLNQSPTYLDARRGVKNLDALKALDPNTIPEGFESYVESEDCKYKFLSSNNSTEESGKWRKIGGASIGDLSFDDAPTKDSDNLVNSGGIYNSLFTTRTKEVIDTPENYVICDAADDGALEIIEDGVEPSSTQVNLSTVTPFVVYAKVGNYVQHVEKVSHMEDYEDNIYMKKEESYNKNEIDSKIQKLSLEEYQSFMNDLVISADGYVEDITSDSTTTTG